MPFAESQPPGHMADHVLVLVKGFGRGAVADDAGFWAQRGPQLLEGQVACLRAALPGCALGYIACTDDDPVRAWATQAGLETFSRQAPAFGGILRRLADKARAVAVVPAANPFLVAAILQDGLALLREGYAAVYFEETGLGIAPEILVRSEALGALGDEELRDSFFAKLRENAPALAVVTHAYAHARLLGELFGGLRLESPADLARIETVFTGAGLAGFGPGAFDVVCAAAHRRLAALVAQEPEPAGATREFALALPGYNARLALLDYYRGARRLTSFPVEVCLNLVDVCNARCVFCGYHGTRPSGLRVRPEDLEQLDWLRCVTTLMLNGGYGEPLLHPRFPEILQRLTERFPGLSIGTPSNGACLQDEKLEAVLRHLRFLRVSLNAATPQTHARLMPPLSWDTVLGNVRTLAEQRAARGYGPKISLHYVFYRDNARELVALPALAAGLGVDGLSIEHCAFGASPLVDESSSLRNDAEGDAILAETARRCQALGLECSHPPLGGAEAGARRAAFCSLPWTHLFVAHDCGTYVCCKMNPKAVAFPRFEWLDGAGFLDRVWNAPGMMGLRQSLSEGPWQPQCRQCLVG